MEAKHFEFVPQAANLVQVHVVVLKLDDQDKSTLADLAANDNPRSDHDTLHKVHKFLYPSFQVQNQLHSGGLRAQSDF